MADDLLDPTAPAPTPPGQLGSPVQPLIVDRSQTTPMFNVTGSLPGDLPGGDFTKAYMKTVREHWGLQAWQPDLKGPGLRRALPEMEPLNGRTITPVPEGVGGPIELNLDRIGDPKYVGKITGLAGLAAPILDPLRSWMEMNHAAASVAPDPNYDPFADRQISDAGLDDQMSVFHGSQSREQTKWLIGHIRDKQKDADWMSRAPGYTELGHTVTGLIGDPTNWIPGTAGVKGLQLASRGMAGKLTGNEIRALAARPAVYGGIADGLRNSAITGAFMIAENAVVRQLDPTIPGLTLEDLVLPGAIAGSIGMLTGVASRWTARNLAQEAQQADFLKPPGARPYGAEGPRPGGIEEPGPPYPPSNGGAFGPGALNTDYGPMRTAEHTANPANAGFTEAPVVSQPRTAGRLNHDLPADAAGARELVLNGQSRSAAEFETGHLLHTPSGEVWTVAEVDGVKRFARSERLVDQEFKPGELEAATSEGSHQPGSVGAQLSPASLAYQHSVLLAQGRLAPTGIGLQHMPINPLVRAFQGASVAAMRFAADLASTGGLQTVGNKEGIANLAPVEVMFQMNWNKRLVDALRHTQDQWSAYRKAAAGHNAPSPDQVDITGRSDWKRVSEQAGTALKDRFSPGERPLSYEQFRIRIAEALNNGDVDELSDAATPYINKAASYDRTNIYNHAKERALEADIFQEAHEKALYKAQSGVRAMEREAKEVAATAAREKWSVQRTRDAEEALIARTEDAKFKLEQMQKKLDELKANGPLLNGTALSYRPRLWDTGKLLDNEEAFVTKVTGWLQSKAGGTLDTTEAVRVAKQLHEQLSHQNPIFERGDANALFQSVAAPDSAYARSFTIPDKLVKEFLVNDSEVLARYHVQQMGRAIEFKERFGSLDGAEQMAEIERDYRNAIEKANAGSPVATDQAKLLAAQLKTALADAQALRDKYYGTYGASPDPHRWDSRTIRMAKQFNNLTILGMSGISALGDLVRPLMTEGLDAMYGYGFKSLMSESRATILRMNKAELELEGNGMELQLNVRAMAAADTGDMFGSRGRFENGMNKANAWMFVANGLNGINQIDKEWARLSIGGRVNNVLLDLLADVRFSERDRGRFAAVGIDEIVGKRIAIQLNVHGVDFGSGGNALTMPNTGAWTDDYARDVYRSAMNQMVNRTVPTPGIGDRPNWISTEWGSLIGQYKSFAMGSLVRGAYSGLQEGGNQFWYGAAASVGFAVLLNEVRSQLFYDKSTFDKPAPAVLIDGIDRSGVLGWFSDVNKAVETLTGHRVGAKPMMGAANPVAPTMQQVAGTLGGPTAGQGARVLSIANDYLRGHPTAQTTRNWRALTPGGNLPYADPLMDAVYGTGDVRKRAP